MMLNVFCLFHLKFVPFPMKVIISLFSQSQSQWHEFFFFEQILVLDSWVFWFRFFHMNWFTTIRLKWISESVNQLNYCIQLNQKQIIRPKIQKSVFSQSEDVFLSFFLILYKDLCLCLCFYLYHSLTCNGVDHKREKEFINTIYPQFIVLFPWIFLFLNFHCPYELVAQTLNS